MGQVAPAVPENIAGQFEGACFPFLVVDSQLHIIYFNKCAEAMYQSSRLRDGLSVMFPFDDCERIKHLISMGSSFNSSPSVLSNFPATAFSFSPYCDASGRYVGAYVLPAPMTEDPGSEMDLRESLLSASTLVVAREYKKCVTEIFYALSAAADRLKSAKVDIVDEQLNRINHSCYRILRNTSNISERIQYASNIQPTVRCVDFWDNCAELFEACSTVLRSRQAAFFYDLPETTAYVNCDFEKISLAILHLVSNCYAHCQTGVQVTVSGRDTAEGVLVTVSDNGPGISSEIQDRIFQPFYVGCTDQQNSTMGLGLNIVRNIISSAGGNLAMNSVSGATTMALSLPRTEAPLTTPELCSTSATYMQDRFSSLYVILCDVVPPPEL